MTFYNRKGVLYASINGQRVSTKLTDTKANRKLFLSYSKNNEFFKKFNVKNNTPNVLDLCLEVLEEKETELKSTTMRSYYSMYKSNIVPNFDKLIVNVDANDIHNWYKTFTDKASITTCEAILKPAFEKAILRKFIDTTPFIITKPRLASDYEIKPFNLKEVELILTNEDHLKNFLALGIFTGMRTGELIGLKWSDINFNENTINIQRTITGGFEQTPKTKSSKAKISLPVEAISFLKDQQFKTGMREFCFYRISGEKYRSSTEVNKHFKKILKSLKLEDRSIYQTRHTFASLKLSLGERLEWVSYMLRHKNPKITLEKYYKYIPQKEEERVVFKLDLTQKLHTS